MLSSFGFPKYKIIQSVHHCKPGKIPVRVMSNKKRWRGMIVYRMGLVPAPPVYLTDQNVIVLHPASLAEFYERMKAHD